jgi:hypothetical protein
VLVDTFYDRISDFADDGWDFLSIQRYDPTVIVGTTPSGKPFTFRCEGSTVSLTINGTTRSVVRSRELWVDGATTRAVFDEVYARIPTALR